MIPPDDREGWSRPAPEKIPKPTYWPGVVALGLVFTFLGLLTSPLVSAVGVGLLALGLGNWIGEMWHGP